MFATPIDWAFRCARILGRPWLWAVEQAKRARCRAGADTRLHGPCRIENAGGSRDAIHIGRGCHIFGRLLVLARTGVIRVGDECFIGHGTEIWSACGVTIGSRVFISHGVNIHDTNAHPTSARLRNIQFARQTDPDYRRALESVAAAPVTIEDDAWVGFNAVVLKGVTVGRGAIVGAASVVTKDVPAFAIVAGNPARIIGEASA